MTKGPADLRTGPPTRAARPRHRVALGQGDMAVRQALAEILDTLERAGLDLEERGTVQLVLAEVLNNIIEHGYPGRNPRGPITVGFGQGADGLWIHVTDRGCPMPDGQLPIGKMQPLDVDLMDLPEGGFGWFLIQNIAKDIVYERVEPENRLTFRIAVGLDAPATAR